MSTLSFTVTDHDITTDNQKGLAQGSHNFDTCTFTFDSTWESYTKYAVFYQNPSKVYKIDLVNNSCKIPINTLEKAGRLCIGARGEKGDGTFIATTKMISFYVSNGAIDGNTATTEAVESATLAGIREIREEKDKILNQINTAAQEIIDDRKQIQQNTNDIAELKGEILQAYEIATAQEVKDYLGIGVI